jgi:hypothetical protein
MKRTTGIVLAVALAIGAGGAWAVAPASADDKDQTRQMDQTRTMDQDKEMIFGSQLMTEQERTEYMKRIREAKTDQERDRIRAEHHDQMMARAKEKGVVLPEEPMMQGKGPGDGMGMGTGMGAGQGMGGGHGMGGK